ncbi:MAG: FliH/SctL family protein [Planctomycetaceae bacterium]
MKMPPAGRLIKAHAAPRTRSASPFGLDDLQQQCDEYLLAARRQAAETVERAVAEADALRRQAYQEGLAAGRRVGLDASQGAVEARAAELAGQQTREALRTLLPALDSAVAALAHERAGWLTTWEAGAVRLSAALAGKIVRRELQLNPDVNADIVREALQLAAGHPDVQLRLHPDSAARLKAAGDEVLTRLQRIAQVTLVPDAGVSPEGCIVETRHGVIDARLETQLERLTQELVADS